LEKQIVDTPAGRMKKLLQILVAILLFGSLQSAAAQVSEKCFKSNWLQQSHTIVFKIDGARISGTFTVSGDGEEMNYDFTGTRAGNSLAVKFSGGKLPNISPSEMRGLVWTLAQKGTEEILKIKVYGKNYVTNKYAVSFAEYGSCRPSYTAMLGKAKPVSFAKGKTSAAIKIAFADNNDWKAFSINVRKGQALVIEAYGCGVSLYLPDKKLYEEIENPGEAGSGKTTTVLDVMSILSAPQTGNYLVVLQNAGGNPQQSREIVFKITN